MEDKNMKEYNLSNPSVEEEERMIQDSIDAEYEMRKREEDEYYRMMEEDYYRAMEEDYYRAMEENKHVLKNNFGIVEENGIAY